jgi:hypothetical protein
MSRTVPPYIFSTSFFSLAAIAIVIHVTAHDAVAQNVVQFFPGDAYFYVALSEDLVNSLPKDGGTIKLEYDVHDVALGSTAGFGFLRIERTSPKLVQHVRSMFRDYRKDVPRVLKPHEYYRNKDGSRLMIDESAPHLFVYNRDVDWSLQRIALKYNENWPHLPDEAFQPPEREKKWMEGFLGPNVNMRAEVYQPLVKTCDALVDDWGNARRFKPLKVRVPENVAWGVFGEPIEVPVVVSADDIQLVVTASNRYENYFSRQPNATFYRITKDWVKKCTWHKSERDVELVEKVLAEEPGAREAPAK